MNRKDRRARAARKTRHEGMLLKPGTLHREGQDTGCAGCGAPVDGGAFFGAVVSELYLETGTDPEVKKAAQQANGRPVVVRAVPEVSAAGGF